MVCKSLRHPVYLFNLEQIDVPRCSVKLNSSFPDKWAHILAGTAI